MIFIIIYILLPLNIVISTTTHIPNHQITTAKAIENLPKSYLSDLQVLDIEREDSQRSRRDTQPEVGTNLYLPVEGQPVRRNVYQFPPKALLEMLMNQNSLIDHRFVYYLVNKY